MNYRERMMNITPDPGFTQDFRIGHREACHVAAEIAAEADAEIERLRRAIIIPPEGPDRDALVERMARAVAPRLWSNDWSDPMFPTEITRRVESSRENVRHEALAALSALAALVDGHK